MAVRARSGPATIVASGMATTFGGSPLELKLGLEEGAIGVELVFVDDPDTAGLSVATEELESGMRLTLVNFDSADGRGSALPVLIGSLEADLVFLHFRVFRFGRSADHTVHYSFYRARKEDVGWSPVDDAVDDAVVDGEGAG